MKCWFCDETGGTKEYAFVEKPNQPVFDAHSECVKARAGEALVEYSGHQTTKS